MSTRALCALAAAALAAIALVALRPPSTPGGGIRDFQAYVAAGNASLHGDDPYAAVISRYEPQLAATPGAMLPFVGTPASLPWWVLLARLPAPAARAIWTVLLGLSACALLYAITRIAGLSARLELVCTAIVAVSFAPLDGALALGQSAVAGAAATALAVILPPRVLATLFAWIAIVLQPNLALALLGTMRRRGMPAVVAFAAIAAGIAAFAAAGLPLTLGYPELLRLHGASEFGSLLQLTPLSIAGPFAGGAIALAALAVAVFIVARSRDSTLGFCAACAALPLVSSFFHVHDFVIVLPALIWCAVRCGAAAIAAGAAIGTNWLDAAQHHAAIPQDAALAVALVLGLTALAGRIDRSTMLWCIASLAMVAAALTAASHLSLGTWPDTLAPFHPPDGIGAPAQWHLELVRSQLFVRHASSTALQAIPLAGCAALLWMLLRSLDVHVHERVER